MQGGLLRLEEMQEGLHLEEVLVLDLECCLTEQSVRTQGWRIEHKLHSVGFVGHHILLCNPSER